MIVCRRHRASASSSSSTRAATTWPPGLRRARDRVHAGPARPYHRLHEGRDQVRRHPDPARRLREGVRHGGRPSAAAPAARCWRRSTAAAPRTWRTWPRDCGISDEDAYEALEELVEWGSVIGPPRPTSTTPTALPRSRPPSALETAAPRQGSPRPPPTRWARPAPWPTPRRCSESEYRQQYRSLPFWKRSVILVAGVAVNLLFAMHRVRRGVHVHRRRRAVPRHGRDRAHHARPPPGGRVRIPVHRHAVIQAVAGLFNPATAARRCPRSTSIVGIAVMSKDDFQAGLCEAFSSWP